MWRNWHTRNTQNVVRKDVGSTPTTLIFLSKIQNGVKNERKRYGHGVKISWKAGQQPLCLPGSFTITQVGSNKFMFIGPDFNRFGDEVLVGDNKVEPGISEDQIRHSFSYHVEKIMVDGRPLTKDKCPTCNRELP